MVRRFFIALLCTLCCYEVLSAQGAGVNVDTKLSPPFSPYIREYVNAADEHLNVKLRNTGTMPWEVVLQMVLENNTGVRVETRPFAIPVVHTLMPGKEVQLNGATLKTYFEPEYLEFKGLSEATYRKGPLPGGIYSLRFNAYDAKTRKLLATGTPAEVWLILSKAPVLVFPKNNEELYLGDSRHFYFEWMDLQDKVEGISRVDYELQIVQIPQSYTGEVASVFHTLPVVFKRTVTITSLMLDFSQSALERGHRYACRVRAKAMAGNKEMKIFENDGYSQVFVFTYKGRCPVPEVTSINFPTIHTVEISWSQPPDINRYTFLIRDVKSNNWERKDIAQPYLKLSPLDYDTTYEYKIRGYCKSYPGAYSNTYTFMLPGTKPVMYYSRIRLTENADIRYNHSDTTVIIHDRITKDSIRVDVRETVKSNTPVSISDDEGNLFTLMPKRSK